MSKKIFICSVCKFELDDYRIFGDCDHKFCSNCLKNKVEILENFPKCNKCFHNILAIVDQKIKCCHCNKQKKLFNFCENHPICKDCITKNDLIQEKILRFGCKSCCAIVNKTCRSCILPLRNSEKIPNPRDSCHIFCESCFMQQKLVKSNFGCKICQKFYRKMKKNICCICKTKYKSKQIFYDVCENHVFCKNCFEKFPQMPDFVKRAWLNCAKCIDLFSPGNIEPKLQGKIIEDIKCISCAKIQSQVSLEKFERSCDDHYFCKVCYKNLSISFKEKTSCEDCKKFVRKSVRSKSPFVTTEIRDVSESLNFQRSGDSLSKNEVTLNLVSPTTISIMSRKNPQKFRQKSLGMCKIHGIQSDLMECRHPFCVNCANIAFGAKFREFINCFLNQNIEVLNNKEWGLGCSEKNCINVLCFTIEIFKEQAILILQETNINEIFYDYYSLVFEGFKMNFEICSNCNNVKGTFFCNNPCWVCERNGMMKFLY